MTRAIALLCLYLACAAPAALLDTASTGPLALARLDTLAVSAMVGGATLFVIALVLSGAFCWLARPAVSFERATAATTLLVLGLAWMGTRGAPFEPPATTLMQAYGLGVLACLATYRYCPRRPATDSAP